MLIICDDVEGNYYIDLVLSPSELKRLKRNEMVCGETILKKRKYYLGIRLQGTWDYEEDDEREEEDREDSNRDWID